MFSISLDLEIKAMVGSELHQVAIDLCRVSLILNIQVETLFNERKLFATPFTTPTEVIEQYDAQGESDGRRRIHRG